MVTLAGQVFFMLRLLFHSSMVLAFSFTTSASAGGSGCCAWVVVGVARRAVAAVMQVSASERSFVRVMGSFV